MLRRFLCLFAVGMALSFAPVAHAIDDPAQLLAQQTKPLTIGPSGLSGPGGQVFADAVKGAQFVLFGEDHFDRETSNLAAAMFAQLVRTEGFRYVASELDPLAVETINGPAYRGDVKKIAALARKYPAHIGFADDQDLEFFAQVTALNGAGPPRLWGLEQAQGAAAYFDELLKLAPAGVREETARLAALARGETRVEQGKFLLSDATTLPSLEKLKADWAPKPGSRADELLFRLISSARIYGYYRRAEAGEPVSLYNNTEREELFRRHFLIHYRAALKSDPLPKAFFKFGANHMYRGRSPVSAFTIANFAHELAIYNGRHAVSVRVVPLGGYTATRADLPAWMQPLIPAAAEGPVLVDLRPLRPRTRVFLPLAADKDQWRLRDLLHGFDFLILLPKSAKASFDLTGFPVP